MGRWSDRGADAEDGWLAVREDRDGGAFRTVLASAAVVIAVVAGLALVGSFFLEPTSGMAGGQGGSPGPSGSDSGGGEGSGGSGEGSGSGSGDGDGGAGWDCHGVLRVLGIAAAVAATLGGICAAFAVARGRADGTSFMETAWGPAFVALATIAGVLLLALAFVFILCEADFSGGGARSDTGDGGGDGGVGDGTGGGGGEAGSGGDPGSGGSDGTGDTEVPPPPRLTDWGLVLLILAGVAVVAVLGYLVSRWRHSPGGDDLGPDGTDVHAREHRQLRKILDRGDLESREAVVAAYRAFLAWADRQGVPRASEDTPMEHAQRVAGRFRFPADEMRPFVAAYQVARLSEREPTEGERESALHFSRTLAERGEGP